ncbi:hypothetical protein IAR55_001897 [Kwoniella newhampshirensis]|uniref:Uncharacterized protein n=1 Tax=Kwoniella newhampshirensis TaxID=1651941 RepID=A0AAW0Z3D5_9TREE
MVKSQRSSATLFHQWPNSSSSSSSHHHAEHDKAGPVHGSANATPLSTNRHIPPTLSRSTPAPPPITLPNKGQIIVPGSPSQTDPFGSQITSPEPVPRATPNPSVSSSRPPSTIWSGSTSPLTLNGTPVVTPRIILASPSTSTIHYLFPSSDTRNGLHLSALGSNSSTSTLVQNASGETESKAVKRSHSTSRTEKPTSQQHRSSIVQSHKAPLDQTKQKEPKVLHGLGYHKKTPSIIPSIGNADNYRRTTRKTTSGTSPTSGSGFKKSDIGKPIPSSSLDYTAAYPNAGQEADMGALRRQPGITDLGEKTKVEHGEGGLKRKESLIMMEIERRRERRGWEIGSRPYHQSEALESSTQSPTIATQTRSQIRGPYPKSYVPPSITNLSQRRRSQSLSSPRRAPSPPSIHDGQISPLLPAPDLGDPLAFSVVIPSPLYSNLDYSTAGSTAANHKSRSVAGGWSMKRTSVVFPVAAPMSRGDTRKGLGGYEMGKNKAREDAAQRLDGRSGEENLLSRRGSVRRSWSLRRKGDERQRKGPRPRSQSMTAARTLRDLGTTPPLPLPSHTQKDARSFLPVPQNTNGTFLGDLSIDLGDRYFSSPKSTPSSGWGTSPQSAATSTFASSTPSFDYASIPGVTASNVVRIVGKPLHPAFNESGISILAPSTVGLGFSPIGSPATLPESLRAEAIDLTRGKSELASPIPINPESHAELQRKPSFECNSPNTLEVSIERQQCSGTAPRVSRRSLLLAQNTFYIPPAHPKATMSTRPSLRSSMSMGQGAMKRAFTSGNLKHDACGITQSGKEPRRGGLLKSASIRSTRARSRLFERDREKTTERTSATSSMSMRFGSSINPGGASCRPLTAFSLCSPPDAVDPLPPSLTSSSPHTPDPDEPGAARYGRTLRSNKHSPFLSASNSLRVIFGKEGFVARSLSQAFDKAENGKEDVNRSAPRPAERSLKSRISSPLEAAPRIDPRKGERQWRESILRDALSSSISSSGANKSVSTSTSDEEKDQKRVVSSGPKSRSAIPSPLLRTFSVRGEKAQCRESRDMTGIGEAMMRSTTENTACSEKGADIAKMEHWVSPSRVLGDVGRDESLGSASVYSNNASTFHESARKSSRRLMGKGLPSNLSTLASMTDVAVTSGTSRWSPSPKKKTEREKTRTFSGRIGTRLISPPIPFVRPVSGVGRTNDTWGDTGGKTGEGVEMSKAPIEFQLRLPQRSKCGPSATSLGTSTSRTGLIGIRTACNKVVDQEVQGRRPEGTPDEQEKKDDFSLRGQTNPKIRRSSSINFSLSLRSSLRLGTNKTRPGSGPSTVRGSSTQVQNIRHHPISSETYLASGSNSRRGGSTSPGISSTDHNAASENVGVGGRPIPIPIPILDQLIARDDEVKIVLGPRRGSGDDGSEEKTVNNKVLQWRDDVDDNEELTKLEDKMRGFVDGERERIRSIGRKSLERGI